MTETQPFTDNDVELVAQAILDTKLPSVWTPGPHLLPSHYFARAALSALSAAGWRKFDGGEKRTEYNLRFRSAGGHWYVDEAMTNSEPENDWQVARDLLGDDVHQVTRTVTVWPDGSWLTGPWLPHIETESTSRSPETACAADTRQEGLNTAELPEPPDGTRIEFEHHTDVYAAWRDDAGSAAAGWPAGDGGKVWVLYGESVPKTWAELCEMFADDPLALAQAVRLVPVAEDLPLRDRWPTATYERTRRPADVDTLPIPPSKENSRG